jgi:tetratricopeptide (TPR) repeat protein
MPTSSCEGASGGALPNKSLNFSDLSVAIIDGDVMSAGLLDNFVKELGVRSVARYTNGNDGWEGVRKGEHHLVILDWVVEEVSGIALFNRLRRAERTALTPVIVTTSALNKHDFALLSEYPCAMLVAKPLSRSEFENSFKGIMSEYASYRTHYELIDNLMNAIHYDGSNAEAIFAKLWTRLPNPIPVAIMGARMLRERGILDVAERMLRKALEFNHKMIPIISELGKVLHKQGKLAEATRVLNHAQSFSPKNVERLLLLGEIHLQQTEPDKAREYFRAVMEIDPRDKRAANGMTVASNIAEHVTGQGRGERISHSFASLMNILAINLVRNRRHADGIKQYEAALSFVHSDSEAARICFNLGLGYLRWGKPDGALEWFAKCAKVPGPCHERAVRYVSDIERKLSGSEQRGTPPPAASIEADLGMEVESYDVAHDTVIVDPAADRTRMLVPNGDDVQLTEHREKSDSGEKSATPDNKLAV